MDHWDQDIHRIQEIHQLLVDRQRYFRGHLNTSCYKLDHNGNPLFFPKLHSTNKGLDSNEPSLGHSVEANFGTTDSGGDNPSLSLLQEDDELKHGSGALSDSSDGNHADHSQNESSDSSDDMRSGKEVAKKKVMKKNPKVLRKWVAKNLEIASAGTSLYAKSSTGALDTLNSRKSSMLRFKSVSFDGDSIEPSNELLKEVVYDDSTNMPSPTRPSKKKKTPHPINLLRRKSWILKAEITSRLNEDAVGLNIKKVITGLTKSSISHAREKLKKAEKSLRATVKNADRIPAYKKNDTLKQEDSKNVTFSTVPKPKPLTKRTVPSRLALRQQEEALRSDINLREAFALIKIDPDPLLELASIENESKTSHGRRTSLVGVTGTVAQQKAEEGLNRRGALDDSKTTYSLQRLTKLSIQHLQKQHSLIPSSIVPPLCTQKGTKEMEKLKKESKNLTFQGEKGSTKSNEFSRRKSSTPSSGSGQQKVQANHKRRLKELQNERTVKLSVAGKIETTPARGERRQSKGGKHLSRDIDLYTLDRLAGTVV